jgi:hypothetical protein
MIPRWGGRVWCVAWFVDYRRDLLVGERERSSTMHRVKTSKSFEDYVGGECTVRMASGPVAGVRLSQRTLKNACTSVAFLTGIISLSVDCTST